MNARHSTSLGLLGLLSFAPSSASAQVWTSQTAMPTARHRLAAAVAADTAGVHCILAFGGTDGGLSTYSTVEMFHPVNNSWSARASMPAPLAGMAAATSQDTFGEKVYLVGGSAGGNGTTTFWEFDNIANSWNTSLPPLPAARTYLAAATGPDGKVYAFGGYEDSAPFYHDEVYGFDPLTGSWSSAIPPMPHRRQKHAAVTGCDGLIYIVGGGNGSALLELDVFDPIGNVWLPLNPNTSTPWASVPSPRYDEVAGAMGRDGLLYLIGGDGYPIETGIVDAFDPSTNTWIAKPAEPTTRNGQAAVGLGKRVYAIGGWKKFGGVQTSNQSFGNLPQLSACIGVVQLSPTGIHYCTAADSSLGLPAIIGAIGSDSVADSDLRLSASPVPNQPGLFFFGPNAIEVPFGEGYRCVGGNTQRLPVSFPQGNTLSVPVFTPGLASPIAPGDTVNFQAWYRDPQGGPVGFNLSDGFRMTFVP